MKKIVIGIVLSIMTAVAWANHPGKHNHHGHHQWHGHKHRPIIVYRDYWVAPLVGGIVLGSIINESNRRTIIEKESFVVEKEKRTVCSEWREIQTSDGAIYRERSCKEE